MTPTRRADGPSACPCDSSHGPGGVGASDNSRSVMQQAEKSMRVRNAGEELRPRLLFCRVLSAHGCHVFAHGAAGAVKRLSFRTPLRGNEEQDDRQPWGRTRHGAMTRVWTPCSPDER